MQQPIIPANEPERIQALVNTTLLDSVDEPRFDRLTQLVKLCLGTEIVLISLVDTERQWFKSRQGLDACETSRDISFCGHAILSDNLFEIADARCDKRFSDNPLVTGEPYIRFYAGVPLTIEQQRIGTLCIIDPKPRHLNEKERLVLRQFADAVEQEIGDRLQEQSHQKLAASELMQRSVLEGTRIGTWQWNVQSGETVFNKRWVEIVGYTLSELMPLSINTWISLAHPDDLVESGRLLEQHFAGELAFYDFKCRMKHKNGHWVWVHDRGRVVSWTDDGKPLMMYGTHADITEQKYADIELQAIRDQFQTLVDNIPGITYRCKVDSDWTMLYMSGSIDPLSGYPASDFINNAVRSYASVIHPDDCDWLEAAVLNAVNVKQRWILQYRVIHKDGNIRWVEERGQAEYNDNEVLFLDGFILDITEEKSLKQQLLKLTSQLPGVVYQYQQWPDGRRSFPYASDNIEKIYGVLPEQVKHDALPILDKIHPQDLPGLLDSINKSAATLSNWQYQYRVLNSTGGLTWLSGHAAPERMPDGSTLWHGYLEDITNTKQYYLELERVNKALKLSQERLDTASENALIGFWQASLDTGELWWSSVIYQIFGFEEATTTPSVALFKNAVHPDDRDMVIQSEKVAQETGLNDVVHRIIRPDGTIRWVHELARMLPVSDSAVATLIGSVQDVTERMQLQQLKSEFISTVSHELRTPLTSIKGALGLVNSGKLGQVPEKMFNLLTVAHSNSERLSHLIDDLLDIEKLAAGKMSFDLQVVSVQKELQHAIRNLQPYAKQFAVIMQLQLVPSALCIKADASRLQQVLTNLLSNAIKFSSHGATVTIGAKHEADKVNIEVTDNGLGLAPEFQPRVFERFAQADGSSSRQRGGTGLGLAICKELVEQMGGSIGFRSVLQQGSTFFVSLPLHQDSSGQLE